MKLKIILIILAVFCMFWAFGCGNSELSPGDEGTITVEVINNSGGIVSYAVFFNSGEYEWGKDELDEEIIPNGESYLFVLPEGQYYFFPQSYEYYVLGSYLIDNQDTTVEIGSKDKVAVGIENHTKLDIHGIFLSPVEQEDWGENFLDEFSRIAAEIGRRMVYVHPGNYDFLALDLEGNIVLIAQDLIIEKPITLIID